MHVLASGSIILTLSLPGLKNKYDLALTPVSVPSVLRRHHQSPSATCRAEVTHSNGTMVAGRNLFVAPNRPVHPPTIRRRRRCSWRCSRRCCWRCIGVGVGVNVGVGGVGVGVGPGVGVGGWCLVLALEASL